MPASRSTTPPLRGLRWVSVGLLVAFLAAIAVITVTPGPPVADGQRDLIAFLARAHTQGLPQWVTFGKLEFGANVLMFVPIGLFGALALSRARWLIVPAAVAMSAVIEAVQAAGLPARDGTARDVIANGVGALIGYLVATVVLAERHRRIWLRSIPRARPAADRPRMPQHARASS
ncbi:MAG TPA: VanZ family protein [Nakamurella sp.]|nr:VanZ family protein [Nakamurella sp.]